MIALFVALGCAVAAQSQHPQTKPADASRPSQPDVRGTNQAPLTVRVLPSTITDVEAAQIKADREQEAFVKNATISLSVLTFLLGLGQLIVYGIQAKLLRQTIEKMDQIAIAQGKDMRDSIAETRRTANAAIDSANIARNTMVLQLRARLGLESIDALDWTSPRPIIRLVFKNFGGKGATVLKYCGFAGLDGLPSTPPRSDQAGYGIGVPVEAGDVFEPFVTMPVITPETWDAIHASKPTRTLYIWGFVQYNAGFGEIMTVGFGRSYDPKLSQRFGEAFFSIAGGANYNYAD